MLYQSTGILHYAERKGDDTCNLRVVIDPDICMYYRALVPKWIVTRRQAYAPHISVVRKVIPPNLEHWGKYEGEEIEFSYSNIVHFSPTYMWLNCFSVRLEEIRRELGLSVHDEYTLPPAGFLKCFHSTIANFKGLPRDGLSYNVERFL